MGRANARDRARSLRQNQTDAEARLWKLLRAKQLEGWKFRRQFPIGRYVVDFACLAARLIVEADGGQHSASDYDADRDTWLGTQGWRVFRFCNTDILANVDGVWASLLAALATPLPPTAARRAPPSPARGEGLEGKIHG